jgi:hypothetical protein
MDLAEMVYFSMSELRGMYKIWGEMLLLTCLWIAGAS